ncbi:inorganic phosphate transporter [Armillaria borealis]|uniref:Inorganic phosphate transporter n=1 Tax=Armillaria borealis TaxID=47425 RepID=A0AA39JNP5_9AGAR|nr:inorganic phosphate transporter [Armillaria borealis]
MNAGIQNLVISLGAMQVARKIPFDDPDVLNYARTWIPRDPVYHLGNILLCFHDGTLYAIKRKNDQTVLKYVEPSTPMSGEEGKLVTTTVRDYDLVETSKLLRSVYMGIAMMGFLHGYMKFTQPLFIQSLMGLKNLYDAKLVAIHLFGKPAEGDLKRPFKSPPGLFGGATGPQTDNAAITEAEKRVGSKKEE